MNVTHEQMQAFVGGQLEIVGTGVNEYRYRGQISKISIIPDNGQSGLPGQQANLHVEFEYICQWHQDQGFKPDENKPYDLALGISGINDIGNGRICVNSPIVGEMSVFYPPTHHRRILADGSGVDHEKI